MTAWCYLVDGVLVDTGITRMKEKALEVLIEGAPTWILLTHHHEATAEMPVVFQRLWGFLFSATLLQ